jgi:predicted component of type VI protein secretion system
VARLLLESGGERREIKVAGPITVGRSQTAGVYLDDKTLSREHTQFYLDHGRVCVRDLESKNGTYVNGVMLKQAASLKPGDKVKIGVATFTVMHEAGDALPAVSAPLAQAPALHAPAHAHAGTTATAPQMAHAPAPRARARLTPHPAAVFFYRIILLGVILGGAYFSKPIFVLLLNKIQP